jgi:hypothetical protein
VNGRNLFAKTNPISRAARGVAAFVNWPCCDPNSVSRIMCAAAANFLGVLIRSELLHFSDSCCRAPGYARAGRGSGGYV